MIRLRLFYFYLWMSTTSIQMSKKLLLTGLYLIAASILLIGQTDSSFLKLDRLTADDLIYTNKNPGNQQVASASRLFTNLEDLPFNVYVITAEEIYQNGYLTLVDVLKGIPGFRVSQPGSGFDGETFVMRGLYGNSYTKILINSVPIQPLSLNAMPIGAQLPIRQAERIEVFFGPGAVVYGADASAGVINIILKDSDRPVFTRADLGTGDNNLTDLSVTFGGKIGQDKRVLRFLFYANNTQFDNRKTKYDFQNLYNPESYALGNSDYQTLGNYNSFNVSNNTLPHLSRTIGADLKYRGIYFSYIRMFRRDHSSIGFNPVAVAYETNNQQTIGEEITRTQVGFKKDYKKWGFNANFLFLGYQSENGSSVAYAQNTFYSFLDSTYVQQQATPADRTAAEITLKSLPQFNSPTFLRNRSTTNTLELTFNILPVSNIEILGGANIQGFYDSRLINRFGIDPFRTFGLTNSRTDLGTFMQVSLDLNKINIVGGMRYDIISIDFLSIPKFNPRLSVIYKIKKGLTIRGNFATAYRYPSPFYQVNSIEIQPGDLNSLRIAQSDNGDPVRLNPEESSTLEIGTRIQMGKYIFGDFSAYLNEISGLLSYNLSLNNPFNSSNSIYLGYINDPNARTRFYGVQGRVIIQPLPISLRPEFHIGLHYARGSERLPFSDREIDRIRSQPSFLGQCNVILKPGRRFYIHLNNTIATSYIRQFVDPNGQTFQNDGFYTLDLMLRLKATRNFQLYGHFLNVFNKEYGGIDATGFIDDLFYNPQPLRTFRLGLSYSLE